MTDVRKQSKHDATFIRRSDRTRNRRNHGDIDVAFQLFSCGMVWDGNLASKESRDHFVRNGYAVRHEGMQCLTGKGILAFLSSPTIYRSILRRRRLWKKDPLVATPEQIRRAMR